MINPNKRRREESAQEENESRPAKKVRWDPSAQENMVENRSSFYKRSVKPITAKSIINLFNLYAKLGDEKACIQALSQLQQKHGDGSGKRLSLKQYTLYCSEHFFFLRIAKCLTLSLVQYL